MSVEVLLMEFDWCVEVSSSGECDRRRLELDLRVLDEVDEDFEVERCFRILEEVRRPWRRRDIEIRCLDETENDTQKNSKSRKRSKSIKCGFY